MESMGVSNFPVSCGGQPGPWIFIGQMGKKKNPRSKGPGVDLTSKEARGSATDIKSNRSGVLQQRQNLVGPSYWPEGQRPLSRPATESGPAVRFEVSDAKSVSMMDDSAAGHVLRRRPGC